jgi:hypothetical protein
MEPTEKKPPIGLMPRTIWVEKTSRERLLQIADAMYRYGDAGRAIPLEWILELGLLVHGSGDAETASRNGTPDTEALG